MLMPTISGEISPFQTIVEGAESVAAAGASSQGNQTFAEVFSAAKAQFDVDRKVGPLLSSLSDFINKMPPGAERAHAVDVFNSRARRYYHREEFLDCATRYGFPTIMLAPLVGEKPEEVSEAEAKRAKAWPRIEKVAAKRLKYPAEIKATLYRAAKFNSAQRWNYADLSNMTMIYWNILNLTDSGMVEKGWILPYDFFSPENKIKRKIHAEYAEKLEQILCLPEFYASDSVLEEARRIRIERILEAGADAQKLLAIPGADKYDFWFMTRKMTIQEMLSLEFAELQRRRIE
jgi:hypothetical protein